MELKVYPDKVVRGTTCVIEVIPLVEPAPNSQYTFTWRVEDMEGKVVEKNPTSPLVTGVKAQIPYATTSLKLGEMYRVVVTAKGKVEDQSGKPVDKVEIGECYVSVEHAPITQEFVEKLTDRVKYNIDQQLTAISASVDKVATNLGQQSGPIGKVAAGEASLRVRLQSRFADEGETDLNVALWQTIRDRTNAIQFAPYQAFIDRILCPAGHPAGDLEPLEDARIERQRDLSVSEFNGVDAYNLLRSATEAFLLIETGVRIPTNRVGNVPGEASRLGRTISFDELRTRLRRYLRDEQQYLNRIVDAMGGSPTNNYAGCAYVIPYEDPGQFRNRLLFRDGFRYPLMLELIWSYWLEEGMLVQSMNAISRRFQNRRSASERDPLAHLEIDPLRPLNNLLWGYVQDEYRRLTVARRAGEYDHGYGMTLYGKAVAGLRSADTRARFLEAFHNLLYHCTEFFKQADDTTVNADPFRVYNGLREVHLILAEGAGNQFGDLQWTARVEMLTQQWLLARPEMNEFLRGRAMVPYEEGWMGRVDTMKTLQGWTDSSISHFRTLAVFGEQLLLSIRYTDWIGIIEPEPAGNWALYWRPEIQNYLHAYCAVTGVDLSIADMTTQPSELRYMRPSELLRRRLQQSGAVPVAPVSASPRQSFRERRTTRQ